MTLQLRLDRPKLRLDRPITPPPVSRNADLIARLGKRNQCGI